MASKKIGLRELKNYYLGAADPQTARAVEEQLADPNSRVRGFLTYLRSNWSIVDETLQPTEADNLNVHGTIPKSQLPAETTSGNGPNEVAAYPSYDSSHPTDAQASDRSLEKSGAEHTATPAGSIQVYTAQDPHQLRVLPSPKRPPTLQTRPQPRPPMLRDRRVALGAALGFVAAASIMVVFVGPDHLKKRFNHVIVILFDRDESLSGDQAEHAGRPELDNLDPAILDLAIGTRTSKDTLGLLVPAYFDPLAEAWKAGWDGIFHAKSSNIDVIAVIKVPADTGFREDRRYSIFSKAIKDARTREIRVVAYVDLLGKSGETLQDTQHKLDVAAEIRLLCNLLPIDGVFLDHQPVDPQHVPVFKEIRESVRQVNPELIVVSNPRQPCPKEYLSADDRKHIIIQAYSGLDPIDYHLPKWVTTYPPDRFAGWFWGLRNPANLPLQLCHAAARHLGWLYISDPETYSRHRYNRLPPTWEKQVRGLRELNEAIARRAEPPD
jgi:hypothetical protein